MVIKKVDSLKFKKTSANIRVILNNIKKKLQVF